MKKLAWIFAALLLGANAGAQDTTFQFGGSLGVEYENRDNDNFDDDTADRSDEFVQSTRIKVDAVKGDDLSARLTVKNLMLWGDTAAFNGTDTSIKGESAKSNQLLVEEAYGVYRIDDAKSLQFGRGHYVLGQGELISQREYEYIPVSFDGLLYLQDMESFRYGLFYVRGADEGFNQDQGSSSATGNDKAADFYGATFTFKNLPEFLNDVVLHYVHARSDSLNSNAIAKNDRTWMGLSATGEMGMWDYHLAYDNFSGEIVGHSSPSIGDVDDRSGNMFHAGVGANMPEFMGLRLGAEFHQDSGSENASDPATKDESGTYDPLYYDYYKYSGRMEIVKWGEGVGGTTVTGTGLTSMAFKASLKPADDLDLMIDYYIFQATEDQGGEDDLGSEIDIVLKKSYANGMYATAEYGMFMPGDGVTTGDDDASRLYASFGFDF